MDTARDFRFVANKVYTIPGKGVVVTGRVEKGSVSVGDQVGFLGSDGQMSSATVVAIEVSRRLVEEAQGGQDASLLLEGARRSQIAQGTILMAAREAPPLPGTPAPAETPRYQTGEAPPASTPKPIGPSYGLGRSVIFILAGLLILLLLLISLGKLDREKLDPRKWDPRKKLTWIQGAGESDQRSAVSFQPK